MILTEKQTFILSNALNNYLNFIDPNCTSVYQDSSSFKSDVPKYDFGYSIQVYELINTCKSIELNSKCSIETIRTDCNFIADCLFFLLAILKITPMKYTDNQKDVLELYNLFYSAANYKIT